MVTLLLNIMHDNMSYDIHPCNKLHFTCLIMYDCIWAQDFEVKKQSKCETTFLQRFENKNKNNLREKKLM